PSGDSESSNSKIIIDAIIHSRMTPKDLKSVPFGTRDLIPNKYDVPGIRIEITRCRNALGEYVYSL
ncbi:MAG: hypothetical protein COV74_02815, partial [Candidatus Omnitrophica bacterium CG11_big_fil_rev_8_21_14_0_20_45_26]